MISKPLAQLAASLNQDLQAAGLMEHFTWRSEDAEPVKGEPINTAMIILAMVGAGGALTMAAGKGGFLTRLAEVLETWIKRNQVEVTVQAKGSEDRHVRFSASYRKAVDQGARRSLTAVSTEKENPCDSLRSKFFSNRRRTTVAIAG